jgi:hypothetical protein
MDRASTDERCADIAGFGHFGREEFVMKAYVIAAETIKDQAMFDTYRKEVPATLVPFGGSSSYAEGT